VGIRRSYQKPEFPNRLEHTQFGFDRESRPGLHFNGGCAGVQERLDAGQRQRDQIFERRGCGFGNSASDAPAARQNRFVPDATSALFEIGETVTRPHGMRVRVDQRGDDRA
jgi:hypothetical protein